LARATDRFIGASFLVVRSWPLAAPIDGPGACSGVAAYRVPPYVLNVQNGTVECIIETKASAAHQEALAKVLLKAYW